MLCTEPSQGVAEALLTALSSAQPATILVHQLMRSCAHGAARQGRALSRATPDGRAAGYRTAFTFTFH